MNKKISIIILIATFVVLVGLGFYLYQNFGANSQAKKEAIQQAKNYKPDGFCTSSLVPAVHTETGAKYTFGDGCLAPGWKPEQ